MLKRVRDADIHLVRVFVAVAESGGIAAAQDRLNVAASTISTQIANLETRLGFRLCERGRAGFALTHEGEIVLKSSYQLLRDLGRFVTSIETAQAEISGIVRIIMLDSLRDNAALRLAPALGALRAEFPLLEFQILQGSANEVGAVILKREADVAVAWLPSAFPSLSVDLLFHEEQVICCGRGHPLFERAPDNIEPGELEEADWALEDFQVPQSVPFARPPVSTATTNFVEGLWHFVLAGTHLAYMPRPYVAAWIDADLVRPVLPRDHFVQLPISLISRSDMNSDAKVVVVKRAILEAHNLPMGATDGAGARSSGSPGG